MIRRSKGFLLTWKSKTPQINLDIQRELAATLGIDALNFEQSLFLGYSGNRISRIQTPIDQYDVIVELDRDLQRNPNSFNDIYLRSKVSQQMVPFNAVANWTEGVGPASINHFAQFPAVNITFNLAPGVALSDGIAHLRSLASQSFTPKVIGQYTKALRKNSKRPSPALLSSYLVTIFTIYIVLGMLYESFHPSSYYPCQPCRRPLSEDFLISLFNRDAPFPFMPSWASFFLIGIVKKEWHHDRRLCLGQYQKQRRKR